MNNGMKKVRKINGIRVYTSDEVFGKARRTKAYKEAYVKESARIALARQIREQRKKKKLTQAAVAKKVDMPQSVIARLESGSHGISLDTLSKVAHALGKKVTIV